MKEVTRQLILCPTDMNWQAPDRVAWLLLLQDSGLVGEQVSAEMSGRYFTGKQFLQHVSFMGCSPAVEFGPVGDGEIDWHSFIYIYLPEPRSQPAWLADTQMAKPVCPHCAKRIVNWSEYIQADKNKLVCPHCSHSSSVCDWQWRDAGGCAREFICIINAYPREAIPSDNFLQQLKNISGTAWHYFYVNSPLIACDNNC